MQLLAEDVIEVITRQYIPLKEQIDRFVTIPFMAYEKNDKRIVSSCRSVTAPSYLAHIKVKDQVERTAGEMLRIGGA